MTQTNIARYFFLHKALFMLFVYNKTVTKNSCLCCLSTIKMSQIFLNFIMYIKSSSERKKNNKSWPNMPEEWDFENFVLFFLMSKCAGIIDSQWSHLITTMHLGWICFYVWFFSNLYQTTIVIITVLLSWQKNFSGSYTDGLFTMAVSTSFLSPLKSPGYRCGIIKSDFLINIESGILCVVIRIASMRRF